MDETSVYSQVRSRRTSSAMVAMSMGASLLFHGLVAALMLWASSRTGPEGGEEPAGPMLAFEEVELLALGEEKPPEALPRIANPEPVSSPEEAVNLAAEPEPSAKREERRDEEEEAQREREERRRRMQQALSELNNPNRPSNADTPEGRVEGVAGGTATDPELASKMKTFQAQLKAAIVGSWEVPTTLDDGQIQGLAGKVVVSARLSSTGRILRFEFDAKSGNEQFDQSVARVLEKFSAVGGGQRFAMPSDPDVVRQIIGQPLVLRNWDALARRR